MLARTLLPAVTALKRDGVIAYPTEAVFGLGCSPHSDSALQRIIAIKGRDSHKGFILIASDISQLAGFIAPVSQQQQLQLDEHWPGPVTFVAPAHAAVRGSLLCGYRDTLAVRVSSHPVVVQLCESYAGAIVSTSANRSGEAALRDAAAVSRVFGGELDHIVDAAVGSLASPTMILDLGSGQRLR